MFDNSFFQYCIKEWSKLNNKMGNIELVNKFKLTILNFIMPKANTVVDIHDINGIKLLSYLMLNFVITLMTW